jgi:hypothetical protein
LFSQFRDAFETAKNMLGYPSLDAIAAMGLVLMIVFLISLARYSRDLAIAVRDGEMKLDEALGRAVSARLSTGLDGPVVFLDVTLSYRLRRSHRRWRDLIPRDFAATVVAD